MPRKSRVIAGEEHRQWRDIAPSLCFCWFSCAFVGVLHQRTTPNKFIRLSKHSSPVKNTGDGGILRLHCAFVGVPHQRTTPNKFIRLSKHSLPVKNTGDGGILRLRCAFVGVPHQRTTPIIFIHLSIHSSPVKNTGDCVSVFLDTRCRKPLLLDDLHRLKAFTLRHLQQIHTL
jgi:hypothetical protein